MKLHAPRTWAAYVVVGAPLLLLVDLCLDWQKASVDVANVVSVHAAASGWASLGFVAGIAAIGVIVAALSGRTRLTLGLAMAMLVATALAAFLGDANVATQETRVVVDTTLWPAWVGLVLAAATTAAALVPFMAHLVEPPRGLRPHASS